MSQALNQKSRGLGPSAGPMATDSHKATLVNGPSSTGMSQDRCSFKSFRKLGSGLRGWLKGPIHSHSTQQHSWPLVTASIIGGPQDQPSVGESAQHHTLFPIPRNNPRRKGELGAQDTLGLLTSLPSWCLVQFLVLTMEKQPAVPSF